MTNLTAGQNQKQKQQQQGVSGSLNQEDESLNRRSFLGKIGTCAGCTVAAGMLPILTTGCAGSKNIRGEWEGEDIIFPIEKFGRGDFVVLKNEKLKGPLGIWKKHDGTYTAVLLYCTHKQCVLEPEADRLICPCHGSEFAKDGKVIKGPARKDLSRYGVHEDAKYIVVPIGVP